MSVCVCGRVVGHGRLRPGQTGGARRCGRPDIEPPDGEEEGAAVPWFPAQVPELRTGTLPQESDPDQTHLLPQLQRLHLGAGGLPV